jgi:hypothetical protein
MKRFAALLALLVAFALPGLSARARCLFESGHTSCCCDDARAYDVPSLKGRMTCCPDGTCAVQSAAPVGWAHEAVGPSPVPDVTAVADAAPPTIDGADSPDEATRGVAHFARGPPVAHWLRHRALLL